MAGRLRNLFQFRRKVRLGEFPYTYVRVSVMRSSLYKKSEYDKLLKMSFGEISRFMQDSTYSEDVSAFGNSYSGLELIERATNQNLVRTFAKLRRISPPELQSLIGLYLGRFDTFNLKSILRGIYSRKPKEQVMGAMVFAGALKEGDLKGMFDAETIPDAIAAMPKMEKRQKETLAKAFMEKGNLIEVENFLDKLYFSRVLDSISRFSGQGKLFREFMAEEIGILNMMTFLKLKKKGLANREIKNMLVDIESSSSSDISSGGSSGSSLVGSSISPSSSPSISQSGSSSGRKSGNSSISQSSSQSSVQSSSQSRVRFRSQSSHQSGGKASSLLGHLLSSRSDEGIISLLQQSDYGSFLTPESIHGGKISDVSLTSLEENLHAYLLRKSMLLQHQNPLSVDVILGFMFAKEIEVRNLRLLAKAKGMGLPEERIFKHLVM
ncbi:V-type ATPase subunit [Candidatus Woesearchaeota archaeon]|nr:V-type ATPase subunit [Candidatus Woesearchaeota archaeon]